MELLLLSTRDQLLVHSLYGPFRQSGYEVEVVDRAALAVQMAMDGQYAAVIIDDEGIGISARDAAEVITMGTAGRTSVIIAGCEYGELTSAACMSKPVDVDGIVVLLNELVRGRARMDNEKEAA